MTAGGRLARARELLEDEGAAGALKRLVHAAALRTFPIWERLGLHVVPDAFYFPIPNTRTLPPDLFTRQSACVGLRWNEERQLEELRTVFAAYLNEDEFAANEGLSRVDRAILHAMVRSHKPRKIIEIGSGASTRILARAGRLNEADGAAPELTSIDPSPRAARAAARIAGLSRFIQQKVQAVDPAEFDGCDLLFVDSSHVAGIGSDVNFEQLELLPRVKPGCLVHFHDILVPGEYWPDWVLGKRYYWSEQYLLWAFLLFNDTFSVRWASRYMQVRHEEAVAAAFPFYRRTDRLSSFWIQRESGPA
ncbi:MAG: class I SAM-dependent methyltransferase [Acidobacteria bacterium]|nr:class I SAM-dependent methyltransferase [Acidobacteriota bacterium]